jgi:uncharacterized zinc-type alcohol dehydrogenase-like protein
MESSGAFDTKCYAALTGSAELVPHTIKRRAVGDNDVHIKVAFAGICHSDIHQAREEWGPALFPMVPGHEIAGVVVAVGKNVTKFAVGDHAGVGCFVDSCRSCDNCKAGQQNYCDTGMVGTYNSKFKYAHCPGYNVDPALQEHTYGGYCQDIVVDADYTLQIPKNIPLDQAAPLLCAGITVYSPLAHYGVTKGMKVGVAGLGGLGSMAVKFAVAMGCEVTVLSRGTAKKEEAISRLGAHHFINSSDKDELKAHANTFDRIIDTIAAEHDIRALIATVATNGIMIMVGAPPAPFMVHAFDLIPKRKQLVGSLIGGIKETQEMLNYCGEKNIFCEVEVIKPEQINVAYERAINSDVRYRFSIDVAHM